MHKYHCGVQYIFYAYNIDEVSQKLPRLRRKNSFTLISDKTQTVERKMIYHRHNSGYHDSDFACWNRLIRTCHADKVQASISVILEIILKGKANNF